MTKSLSRDEFLRNLSDSGLFSPEEISRSVNAFSGPRPEDGAAVAQSLIAGGSLTPFQAEAVRERNFEQLQIGNYQVLDRLGAGGMGTVYKARHRRMKRVVAIKVLSRQASQSEMFVQRFQREVEAVARLSHPNIVMAHDADEAPVGHFLVMEFVNGRDLASEVQKRGPLPARDAVACIVQAARALEYAHGQGIIHRDIKPANLLRDEQGVVKVADLGLARFSETVGKSPEEGALTQAGSIMGTVDFMSPEQALGLTTIDHRADIYSLGCTLYFLLLGRPPYEGPSLMATLLKHREAPIPSLSEALPGIPAELDAVFRRMVAKAPADRYPTMTEVGAALASVEATLGQAGTAAPPPPKDAAAPAATAFFPPETRSLASPAEGGQTIDLKQSPLAPVLGGEGPGVRGSARPLTPNPSPPSTGARGAESVGRLNSSIRAAPASPPSTGARGAESPAPGEPLKVVLVEPSRTQSGIIRSYLNAQGVRHVLPAATGQQALELVRRERPSAVVSALHLADMTGVQLAQQIRLEYPAAAPGFVLISSEAESAEAGSLSKCGKAIHLLKPFTPEELVEALRMATSGQASAPDRGKLRVLLVDDSTPARLHERAVLQGLGLVHFVEAADGAQAVAALARDTFDLIVTDYHMPFLDGKGLVGYLKQNPATASVPVIMVTTEADPAKLEAVRQLGVAAVCAKRFPAEEVGKVLDRLVQMP